jgi:hypothetical protein
VGPRSGLNTVVKRKIPSPCRDSNPPIIQPVAQRYTTELCRLPEDQRDAVKMTSRPVQAVNFLIREDDDDDDDDDDTNDSGTELTRLSYFL